MDDPRDRLPDVVPIGHALRITRIDALGRVLRISKTGARNLLRDFDIPVDTVGKVEVFNLFALEYLWFVHLMPRDLHGARSKMEWFDFAARVQSEGSIRDYRKRLTKLGDQIKAYAKIRPHQRAERIDRRKKH